MPDKYTSVDQYLQSLSGIQREWMLTFVTYMRENHPELEEVISYQMPTYKLGSGKVRNYIAFFPAKNHFSLHTMDFDYISELGERLAAPGKGKGCVNVSYKRAEEQVVMFDAVEDIIQRNSMNRG